MDKRRLNLSFSMASSLQREAWELLCAIPAGQRTETVCRAVCRMYEQEFLLEIVRQTIREELRGVELIPATEKTEQPQEAGAYIRRLLSAITESGLDVRAMPAIFLGGGAALIKRHVSATDGLCRPLILDDVCLNAKGYERLAGQIRGTPPNPSAAVSVGRGGATK